MHDIFISYAWGESPNYDNQKKVVLLKKFLNSQLPHHKIWLDIDHIKAGKALHETIAKSIRECKVVLIILNQNYLNSRNCIKELALADALGKPIIPLLLDKYVEQEWPPENIDIYVCQSVYLKFNNFDFEKSELEKFGPSSELLEQLKSHLEGESGTLEKVPENQEASNPQKLPKAPEIGTFEYSKKEEISDAQHPNFLPEKIEKIETKNWVYHGDTQNGLPHGYGTKISQKTTHSGWWKNGVPNGPGIKQHARQFKGLRFVGNWVDGFLDGFGSIYYTNGLVYHGNVNNGNREGFGRLFNGNDMQQDSTLAKSESEEKDSKSLKNSDRMIYEGHWLDNKKHGFGTSYGKDGSKYVGNWESHKRHGSGRFYYKNGFYFETEFKHGLTQMGTLKFYDDLGNNLSDSNNWNPSGYQIFEKDENFTAIWIDGSCFVSDQEGKIDSETGMKTGCGTFYSADQQVATGNWIENTLTGENCVLQNSIGRIIFEGKIEKDVKIYGKFYSLDGQGTTYEGEFSKDKYSGEGKLYRQDGSVIYEGQFKKGNRSGEGTSFYLDGRTFTGSWKDGKRHGAGEEILENGKILKGHWRFGRTNYDGEDSKLFQVVERESGKEKAVYEGVWPMVSEETKISQPSSSKMKIDTFSKKSSGSCVIQ